MPALELAVAGFCFEPLLGSLLAVQHRKRDCLFVGEHVLNRCPFSCLGSSVWLVS